jgi:glutathione synthase/RimK-type ligase-like ATP-grasp enzyme
VKLSDAYCWGIFREEAHSPGRESDDSEILRLTAKGLEAKGFQVELMTPDELIGQVESKPGGIFLMCERPEALQALRVLESDGVREVNSPAAVLGTYRERMIAQFAEAEVAFVPSRLVATSDERVDVPQPVWVKRSDVHNTQAGDVVYAADAEAAAHALASMAARGMARAVVQPHVDGDLIKFYGIGPGGPHGEPPWFRWFYHKDQTLREFAFDQRALARLVRRAAAALGLEIYGGDCIVTPAGEIVLIDLNAWPSFALFREEAASAIAAYLSVRFGRGA